MRVMSAAAALAITCGLLLGVMLFVTWAVPPAGLLRWGVRCRMFSTLVPAYFFLFVIPTIVLIMRRRAAAPRREPERWVPGMPSDTGI
jgi:hypothetical protein